MQQVPLTQVWPWEGHVAALTQRPEGEQVKGLQHLVAEIPPQERPAVAQEEDDDDLHTPDWQLNPVPEQQGILVLHDCPAIEAQVVAAEEGQ